MNQIEFLRLWVRMKPAQVKRRTWHYLGMEIHGKISNAVFALRNPRCWWFFQRIKLHVWFGFPMPPMPPFSIDA